MNFGIIGRHNWSYDSALKAIEKGHRLKFIVTAKESPEYTIKANDFEKLAIEHDVPFLHKARVTAADLSDLIDVSEVDVIISVNYSGIISDEIIGLFPLGVLNAHGGDLPRYRGNACQAWAMVNGEDRIGLCIHKMVGGELDSGDILARDYLPIDMDTRIQQVYDWMDKRIPELMIEAIDNLSNDPAYLVEEQSKDPYSALRCYPRMAEDGLIQWDQGCESIVRLVNASSEPYSGAFTYLKDQKFTVWRASKVDEYENFVAAPGQVAAIDRDLGYVDVTCRDGKVRITEAEMANQRTIPAEFIKSIRTRFKSHSHS